MGDTILQRVKAVADLVWPLPDSVDLDASLRHALDFDSLDMAQFVIELEDEFGIDIPETDLKDTTVSLAYVVDYVEKALATKVLAARTRP